MDVNRRSSLDTAIRKKLEVNRSKGRRKMNIFYIIGVVVVVLFVLGYFGFR
jgi:predicted nucleic acid-binding Zn ribbon protein